MESDIKENIRNTVIIEELQKTVSKIADDVGDIKVTLKEHKSQKIQWRMQGVVGTVAVVGSIAAGVAGFTQTMNDPELSRIEKIEKFNEIILKELKKFDTNEIISKPQEKTEEN